MAGPGISSFLSTQRADGSKPGWFPATDLPEFSGVVVDPDTAPESVTAYARLWTLDGRLIWHREMTYTGLVGGLPVYRYQTVYPALRDNYIRFLTFGSGITGGYWRFVWYGVPSADIPWNATEAQIRTAITNHPDIGSGNITVSWAPSIRRLTIALAGRLDNTSIVGAGINGMGIQNFLTGTAKTMTFSEYQAGVGDFATTSGQYKWDMVAYDGGSFSGGKSGIRSALGPAPQVFYLDANPTISSTAPANAGTFTTSGGVFSWTQADLGSVPVTWTRHFLRNNATGLYIHTFSQKGSSLNWLRFFTIPAGTFKNGGNYTWIGEVYKESGAVTKWQNTFTVEFTRPTAHAATFTTESDGSSIIVQWAASALSDAVFNAYVVKVRLVGQAEDGPDNIEIWRSAFKALTIQRLYKFPRNTPFIMSFYVRRNVTDDVVDSSPTSSTQTVNISSVLIANPATQEYVLLDYHDGRQVPYLQDPMSIPVWGDALPVAMLPVQQSRSVEFTAKVVGTLAERQAAYRKVELLYKNTAQSALIYCDAFGFWFDIVLNAPVPTIVPAWNYIEIGISGFEVDALEETA